ncbi:hypothetical protein JCM8097_000784 [Rhodosporidiobolus ruineniae]
MSYLVNAARRLFSSSTSPENAALAKETVESMIQSPVAVFSKSYCPYCSEAKHILKKRVEAPRLKVIELDHEAHGNAVQAYLAERAGVSKVTVPQIFINGKNIGGCSDLKKIESAGKLDDLLKAAQ